MTDTERLDWVEKHWEWLFGYNRYNGDLRLAIEVAAEKYEATQGRVKNLKKEIESINYTQNNTIIDNCSGALCSCSGGVW